MSNFSFKLVLLRSDQNILQAALVLNGKLDYNDKMIYHIQLRATDSVHAQTTEVEIRVKDVQNTPPVFLGSLAAVIDEDSPIGTLVMTVQARDGDKGQPRRISYELITSECPEASAERSIRSGITISIAFLSSSSAPDRSHGLLPVGRTDGGAANWKTAR